MTTALPGQDKMGEAKSALRGCIRDFCTVKCKVRDGWQRGGTHMPGLQDTPPLTALEFCLCSLLLLPSSIPIFSCLISSVALLSNLGLNRRNGE